MTDEFQRGLITGLAMQPLQVTTEHAEPDDISSGDGVIAGDYIIVCEASVIGELVIIDI